MPESNSINNSQSQRDLKILHDLQILNSLTSRLQRSRQLGLSYSNERDIYQAFGYPKDLEFAHYWALYERGDISSRVVNASPDASWRISPTIQEDKDDTTETDFEKAWGELQRSKNIFHHLHRVDRLSGIGRYGILLLGLDDGNELSVPVLPSSKLNLIYLKAYKEDMVDIIQLDDNQSSPRYGLPKMYKLKLGVNLPSSNLQSLRAVDVHYTRVMHVAEDPIDNSIFGTPRMKNCYNRLQNMELIAGSSAEMWYRGAFPGYNFKLDPEAQIGTNDLDKMKDEIESYMHNFKRYLRLRGVDVEAIAPQVSDPSASVDVQLKLISAATGIPTRILFGSERGELASSQDEKNWLDKIIFRRTNYCEPFILRPFIERMIGFGILPKVPQYSVRWPELIDSSELDKASAMERKTASLVKYADSIAAQGIFPPEMYFSKFLGMDAEDIKPIMEQVKKFIDEELRQIEEENRTSEGEE